MQMQLRGRFGCVPDAARTIIKLLKSNLFGRWPAQTPRSLSSCTSATRWRDGWAGRATSSSDYLPGIEIYSLTWYKVGVYGVKTKKAHEPLMFRIS